MLKNSLTLRHASLRNAIERIFGVLERKFRILKSSPEYSIEAQSDIVLALTALHNFTRTRDGSQVDDYIESIENISVEDDSDQPDLQLSLTSNKEMDRFRDLIAEQMWNDYQEHIRKE
jgi:hypothetical protein